MKTKNVVAAAGIAGAIITTAVVSSVSNPTNESVNIASIEVTKPDVQMKEVGETTNAVYFKDGKLKGATVGTSYTFEMLKYIKEVDGVVAYKISDSDAKKYSEGYDVELADGTITFTKGDLYNERQVLEKESYNEKIYKEIAEKMSLKIAKGEENTAEENAQISKLRSKLKK